jgi:hypothetical protein
LLESQSLIKSGMFMGTSIPASMPYTLGTSCVH